MVQQLLFHILSEQHKSFFFKKEQFVYILNIFSITRKLPAICMYVVGLILEEILQSGQRRLRVAEKNNSWLTNKGKEQK